MLGTAEYIGLATTFSAMIFTNLVGNTLVIIVVFTKRSMRTPMNFLLVNLAVADILVGIFIGVRFVINPTYQHPTGTSGKYLCKFITGGTPAFTASVASIYSLVAISVERYYAVLYPFREERLTPRNLTLIFFGIWLLSFLWVTPLYMIVTYRADIQTCGEFWPNLLLPRIYSFGWNIVAGVMPISIMSFLYSKVVYRLWFNQEPDADESQKALLRSRKRVTKMVLAVSVIYVICWVPTVVVYFLAYVIPDKESVHSLNHKITIALATFNSTINPIIYSFQSQRFRQNLLEVLCCKVTKRNQVAPSGRQRQNTSNATMGTSVVYRLWFNQEPDADESQKALLRSRKRVTKMVLAVSVIYVICWVPTVVVYFLAYVIPDNTQ